MKKIIFSFILGILISSVAYAAVSISSDKVGYKDTTVKDSLDNLFNESVNGKNSITTALSNKGFNVNNSSTYSEIVNGINELPVTIGKDEDGNYGYYKDVESSFIAFSSKALLWENSDTSSNVEFVGQTFEFDLTKYRYICVDFLRVSSELNNIKSVIVPVGVGWNYSTAIYLPISNGSYFYRYIYQESANNIRFTNASPTGGGSVNNLYVIPYKIYGIN